MDSPMYSALRLDMKRDREPKQEEYKLKQREKSKEVESERWGRKERVDIGRNIQSSSKRHCPSIFIPGGREDEKSLFIRDTRGL